MKQFKVVVLHLLVWLPDNRILIMLYTREMWPVVKFTGKALVQRASSLGTTSNIPESRWYNELQACEHR